MAADILAREMSSKLRLQSKTIGADRIKKAKDNNEDVAVLSMFLPLASAKEENARFRCHMGLDCFLGDCTKTTAGCYRGVLGFREITFNGRMDLSSLVGLSAPHGYFFYMETRKRGDRIYHYLHFMTSCQVWHCSEQ